MGFKVVEIEVIRERVKGSLSRRMKDGDSESTGVLASGWPLLDAFVDIVSNKETCDGDDDAVGDFVVWLLWLCACCGTGLSCSSEPCEKDSNACGVPREISCNLGGPVGGKKEVVPRPFTAPDDDWVTVCRRAEAVVE